MKIKEIGPKRGGGVPPLRFTAGSLVINASFAAVLRAKIT